MVALEVGRIRHEARELAVVDRGPKPDHVESEHLARQVQRRRFAGAGPTTTNATMGTRELRK